MKAKETHTYSPDEKEYVIELKKKNYWWLLLFLLPLVLLIKLDKDVVFKTVDSVDNKPLQGTFVDLTFHERYLFNFSTFSFFSNDKIQRNDSTNEDGIVVFKDVSYSVFSMLFFATEDAYVTATNNCFSGDSISPRYHGLKHLDENILKLPERSFDLEFMVVDADDGEPLPEAEVVAISRSKTGKEQSWKKTTDVAGLIVLEGVPYCGEIELVGSKYGYDNDTIKNKVEYITGKIESGRTLRLKPIKTKIKFIVRDLKTKETIPNVVASLKIEGKTVSTLRTNTNGVGIGFFDDIRLLDEFTIMVQKAYYYDTTRTDKVDKFIKLDEKKRTIYMRPKKQNITFRNINAKTGKPIAGVKNEISINGSDRKEVEYSNSNGTFIISGVFGEDKISITASKSGYKPNSHTIRNGVFSDLLKGAQNKRDIPLEANPPPPPPPGPRKNCRVFFTGLVIGDEFVDKHISKIYRVDKYSEYVGAGEYPDNSVAFPKSVKTTFDGMAIDKETRVIIYSGKNFTGRVLLDKTGPAIINNIKWKDDPRYNKYNTKTYSSALQANFPQSVRSWSSSDMQKWSNGSVKVICGQ